MCAALCRKVVVFVIRGTDQTFKFKLPCVCGDIEMSKVVLWQEYPDNISQEIHTHIVKENIHSGFPADSKEIYLTLNPSETAQFSSDRRGYLQMSAMVDGGFIYGTKKIKFTVYENNASIDIPIPPSPEGITFWDGQSITE